MQEVARPCHALHVARLEQQYAGYGIVVQPVLQRGFVGAQERPASAAAITTPVKSPERRAKGMVIHAHLREHVLPIQCGEGNQRVFWLAVNAVQRYLTDLASYNHAFSAELTPKGVVSESLEYICKTGRICDELKDGDHVWIDVGDGTPLSRVNSRPFGSQKILDDDECVARPRCACPSKLSAAELCSACPVGPPRASNPPWPTGYRAGLRRRSSGSNRLTTMMRGA